MTKKTLANLKTDWHENDPSTWVENLLDSVEHKDDIPAIADAGTGYDIFVSKGGHDTNGNGSKVDPYLTITKALQNVSSDKQTVYVFPGTYTENLTWPATNNVKLQGLGPKGSVIVKGEDAGTGAIKFAPAADQGAIFNMYLKDISLQHAGTGLAIDNSGMGSAIKCYLENVEGLKDGGTSILVTSNGSAAIELYLRGRDHKLEGEVMFDLDHADDVLIAFGIDFEGGLQTSANDKAAEITLKNCTVKHEGVTGGHSGQTVNAINCVSKTGETYAMLDTADLAGSQSENLIPDPGAVWPTT